MKRICSALLTLALCLSLCTPALAVEGGYFADEKDIVHLEAATNLVRLGVMWGKEDGSFFAPKDKITRGEAVKYITLLLRGGKDIVAPAADPAFPDVGGHWAETYINYCAEKGVVLPQRGGNFEPDGFISRLEFVGMLEVVLGDKYLTHSTANWEEYLLWGADGEAYDYGLYVGLEDTPAGNGKPIKNYDLCRDEAAQLLYNALNATPKVQGEKFLEDMKRPDGSKTTLLYENFGYDSWDDVPALPAIGKGEEQKPKPARGIDPTTLTDAKDIQYWPAVATLAKLGVIDGKDDGSFDPTGNVTRAEAAKLIAVIMGGGEANAAVKAEPAFTDIQGHWAEDYINYCADMGIVSGWDGRFDPDGQVSVLQMYKMALTALGYDWAVYRLAGSSWAEQALECARKADGRKLTEGLANNGMDGTGADQPATREMVAQILYNALQATTIEVVPDKNTSSGEIVWSYQPSSLSLLQVRFGLKELPTIPAQPTL